MSACPICKKTAPPRAENPSAPFCSSRCRTIDLGKWLTGDYRVPTEDSDDNERGEAAPGEGSSVKKETH